MIRILYFGIFRDMLGRAEEQLPWYGEDTETLLQYLRARGDRWARALSEPRGFRLAVNQQIIYEPVLVRYGDEVAILPLAAEG